MKYNKWTVALAALGVVSFASAAKAEEKASPVMTALSSTTISGYVDTSAEWNPGTGNANLPPYKFGGAGKADGFNLDVIQLRIDKPLDEEDWAAGYRADLWFGPDAKILGTDSYLGLANIASDFAIRQAYVALRAPVGTGLDFKMGVFDSILGYESVEAGNNPNFTRSFGHSIEPQTHTGLLASYRFCDCFSASFGVADTMGPSINSRAFPTPIPVLGLATLPLGGNQAESYKTYMGSIALTAPDSWGFLSGSTLYGGVANGFSGSGVNVGGLAGATRSSYYVGATVATPVTGLRAGAAFDYLDIHSQNNDTYSVAGYLSLQATEKLSFHARAEYFKDKADDNLGAASPGVLFNVHKAEVLALTATVQYDLWKNVISRLELRWDHSLGGNDLFGGGAPAAGFGGLPIGPVAPTSENAWMLALNVIYKF
jgi:Putative beta-barrel porin-2, OmpL-like. bbp2